MISSKRKVNRVLFKPLLEKGRSFHSENFALRVAPLPGGGESRFAVVVPKRIEKTAVGRNATKRLFFRVVETILSDVRPGILCVFFLKKRVRTFSFEVLRNEVFAISKKAGVM
jgi:ribonuclease P protein component